MKAEDLKLIVKEKYGGIASQSFLQNQKSCCGSVGCCEELEFSMIGDEYTNIEGHNPEADLGLGCGLPTKYAGLKAGDHVLDEFFVSGNIHYPECQTRRQFQGSKTEFDGDAPLFFLFETVCVNSCKSFD